MLVCGALAMSVLIQVQTFMSRPVISLAPGDSLRQAVEKMEAHQVRHFPVVQDGPLVGVVSDRDVYKTLPALTDARRATAVETLDAVTVEMVMTKEVITIGPEDFLLTAAKIFASRKIGCLPVVEPVTGHLIGIITPQDVLRAAVASGALSAHS